MIWKEITKEVMILIGVSFIFAFGINYLSPKGIAIFGKWDLAEGVISAKAKDDTVMPEFEIDHVSQAKTIYDSRQAIFLDARSLSDYAEGHIKGAIPMPVGDAESRIAQLQSNYAADTMIVTYCSGRECDDSHKLAQYLFEQGYFNVSVFIDGYPVWAGEGFPIEK